MKNSVPFIYYFRLSMLKISIYTCLKLLQNNNNRDKIYKTNERQVDKMTMTYTMTNTIGMIKSKVVLSVG